MTTKRELGEDSPPAILASDPIKRLEAIVRRHGGKPKTETPPGRIVLPSPGRRVCKGQLSIDEVVSDE